MSQQSNASARCKLNQLAEQIKSSLLTHGIQELPVPEEFFWQGNHRGEHLTIQPNAFSGSELAFGRLVRVDGGEHVQVLNLVLFPARQSLLPIFGCEILAFRRGLHLFVLDAFSTIQHTMKDDWYPPLLEVKHQVESLHSLEAIPEWGKSVFSENAIVLKPSPHQPVLLSDILPMFWALWRGWLTAYQERPQATMSQMEDVLKRRASYLHHHAVDEPAGPFLQRLAGEEWSRHFIHDFLFPEWLTQHDRKPPWHVSSTQELDTTSTSDFAYQPSVSL